MCVCAHVLLDLTPKGSHITSETLYIKLHCWPHCILWYIEFLISLKSKWPIFFFFFVSCALGVRCKKSLQNQCKDPFQTSDFLLRVLTDLCIPWPFRESSLSVQSGEAQSSFCVWILNFPSTISWAPFAWSSDYNIPTDHRFGLACEALLLRILSRPMALCVCLLSTTLSESYHFSVCSEIRKYELSKVFLGFKICFIRK